MTIPYRALREAVLNAITHRSYRDPGEVVSLAIYDDRLEIENPGRFPSGWSISKIESSHGSKPQNPVIASVLYKRKLIERWGRGIHEIITECQKAGLAKPTYIMGPDSVVLSFKYSTSAIASQAEITNNKDSKIHTDFGKPDGDLKSKSRVKIKEESRVIQLDEDKILEILLLLKDRELSAKILMGSVGLKHRTLFSKQYLLPAIEGGYIKPVYPDKPKHPKQRYVITEKGQNLITSMVR